MSIIGSKSLASETAISDVDAASALFESGFLFEATPALTSSVVGIFQSRFEFVAIDVFEFAEFVGGLDFVAHGFLNAEPNITDTAIFESLFGFQSDAEIGSEALAVFESSLTFEAFEHLVPAPEYSLAINLTILPSVSANPYIRLWLPRLTVDGQEVPIISWQAPEGESNVGRKLSVVLQRTIDKDLFTADSVISFGIGQKIAGVWDEPTFLTLIADGAFQVSSHTISGQPQNAADRVTIESKGNLSTRLNTYPEQAVVVYDPARIVQRTEFYQTQYDQLGNSYTTDISSLASLSLKKLMNYVFVTKCGFTTVDTNLPDYPILQNYFSLGERFYDGLKKFIGIFNPIIYQDGETIALMDATLLQPDGFPDPETIVVDRVTNIDINDDRSNRSVNAIRIQFIHNIEDYDVVSERDADPVTERDGDNTVTINQKFRTYAKSSQPFIVQREELIQEIRETTTPDSTIIARSTELFTFGIEGNPDKRKQTIEGFYPDLDNWVGAPTTEPPYLFGVLVKETETFEYKAYPIDSLDGSDQRTYCSRRAVERRGKVIVDAVNLHLGKTFRQELGTGIRSANVTEDTTLADNFLIKTLLETGEPVPGGFVYYTNSATDYLPAKPQPYTNYSQRRPGDIAARQFVVNQKTILIRPPGTEPIQGIQDYNFGELGLDVGIPLAERYVKAGLQSPRNVTFQYIGYDDSIRAGQVRSLASRDGVPFGKFLIIGRIPSGDANGTFMQLVCREVGG